MKITTEEVAHVAKLARLQLTFEEVRTTAEQLDRILTYVAKLDELDTRNIVPTTHAMAIDNAFREDMVQPSLDQKISLASGPRHNGESFTVPKVI